MTSRFLRPMTTLLLLAGIMATPAAGILMAEPIPANTQSGDGDASPTKELTMPDAPLDPVAQVFALMKNEDLSPEQRREQIQPLLNANPDSADIWASYGEVLFSLSELDLALRAWRKATELEPELYSPWLGLGLLYKRDSPLRDLAEAEVCLRKALNAGAPRARTLNELAVTMAMQKRMKEAVALWEEALEEDPDWGVLYHNLFKGLLDLKDWKGVEKRIPAALEAKRFSDNAILFAGEYQIERNRPKEAIKIYTQAVERHPGNARLHYYLGMAQAAAGDKKAAIATLTHAREIAPKDPDAADTAQAAEWSLFKIQYPGDEKSFQKTREMVFAQGPKGSATQKDLAEAVKLLTPLVAKHPTFWNGLYVRGVAHRRQDNRAAARRDFEAVLALFPEEPNTLLQLALLMRDELEFDAAADTVEKAVKLAPRDPSFIMNASFIQIEAKNCDRAWELYHQVARMMGAENTAVLRDELEIRCPKAE